MKKMRNDMDKLKETMKEFDFKLIRTRMGFQSDKERIWQLGMNINPGDEHLFGYTVGKNI